MARHQNHDPEDSGSEPSGSRELREIDLHGLRLEQAIRRLSQELYMARARGERIVRVVTGRGWNSSGGQGVLRPAVERWLKGPDGKALGVHSLESIAKDGAWRVHMLPVDRSVP